MSRTHFKTLRKTIMKGAIKESFVDGVRAVVANDQAARGLLRFHRCGATNSMPRAANRSRRGSLS
jgi:hypothetical protein